MQPLGAAAQMALPGSFAVSEGGAATYDIPIDVPPGTAGMEPKLSLTYSSGGGNGLLGVGWALSGLSQISRCAQTVATDGQHGGVNYDADDRFCLNGDLLVAIAGTYGADGTEYRTQSEGFSRIVSHGTAGYGPASFTVWTKAGLKMEFGHTADSRIEAQGKSTVRLWALNRVTDTADNYMTVTYHEDSLSGGYRVSQIDYGANAVQGTSSYASVRFSYEARPDNRSFFQAGAAVGFGLRLSLIDVQENGIGVSEYRLTYAVDPVIKKSHLIALTRCTPAGQCLPAKTMGVSAGIPSDFAGIWSGQSSADWISHADARTLSGDFNGDGLTDLAVYRVGLGGIGVYLANGDGSFSPIWNSTASADWISYAGVEAVAGDFNGDGLTDIAMRNSGFGGIGLYLAIGGGSFGPGLYSSQTGTDWISYTDARLLSGDFNGDGLADLAVYRVGQGGIGVYLSQGNGSFTPTYTDTSSTDWISYAGVEAFSGDVNGDGLSDIVMRNDGFGGIATYLASGSGYFASGIFHSQAGVDWISQPDTRLVGGDFNEDGLSDIAVYRVGMGAIGSYLSRGDGSYQAHYSATTGADWISYAGVEAFSGDFNGDGVTDIGMRNDGLGGIGLYLGTGSGTFSPGHFSSQTGTDWISQVGREPLTGDFNGDGVTDIAVRGTSLGGIGLYEASSRPANVVVSISNGLGSTSHIEYASLSEAGAPYTKDSGANAASYPQMDIHAPAYVVSELRADDGIGGVTTTRYRYGGLKYDHELRQALGFRWREVEQVEAQVVKRTEYRQDFPFVGMTELSQTRVLALDGLGNPQGQAGTNLVRESSSTYACRDFVGAPGCDVAPNRRYYVYQASSTERGWDLDGSELPETETASTYDNYGNALTVNVTVTDKPSAPTEIFTKNTTNTYAPPNLTDWIHGRLTRAEVMSTSP